MLGMVATFQPFVAPLRARGQGRLVGIASVAGIRGLPGAGAYSASKAAVIAYLESLRVELHGSGVKVVTIAPGYIETPMTSVNTYPMPFLLPADQAAVRFARAIEAGVSYTVIPWQMGVVGKLLRLLPDGLFDRLLAGRPILSHVIHALKPQLRECVINANGDPARFANTWFAGSITFNPTFGRVIPISSFTHGTLSVSGTSAGRVAVTVWPNVRAKA